MPISPNSSPALLGATKLEKILTENFAPFNAATANLFPAIDIETPIAVRYALIVASARNELQAACHPIALSFFGTKDYIPEPFCASRASRARIVARIQYVVLTSEHPYEGAQWGRFLAMNGIDPFEMSRDMETEVGWANAIGDRMANYFKNDGWNSQGDVTKRYLRNKYEDSTGYVPENNAALLPDQLLRPLRWQPLTRSEDLSGAFSSQLHIVPHIGIEAKPLVLSKEDFESRRVPSPYQDANRENTINKADSKTTLKLVKKLLQRSQNLTPQKIAKAFWWEEKYLSQGTFASRFRNIMGFSNDDNFWISFADNLALHDALLVAWKEKRRHDLVRPTTLVRRLMKGKNIRAWRGVEEGVGDLKAEEWEPLVPIQAHSEYPSGSAATCWSGLELLDVALKSSFLIGNNTIPPLDIEITPEEMRLVVRNYPLKEKVRFTYKSLQEAARSCGESRLDAGVHFEPSVNAGYEIAKGIGKAAFQHARDLYEGRVPNNCARCL